MTVDSEIEKQLVAWFAPLKSASAANSFPPRSSLSTALDKLFPRKDPITKSADPKLFSLYMTAAVDMWLRGVHSFLISSALTDSSPVWATVSGYYASHYAVRGLAHLLGYFQLFRRHRITRIHMGVASGVLCDLSNKNGGDREHKLYWAVVKRSPQFANDPIFNYNKADPDDPKSMADVDWRDRANYTDHLGMYVPFTPLTEQRLRERIDQIAKVSLDAAPLPRTDKPLDVDYMQLIAYHRIIAFRSLLDEVLGSTNRFWNVHRTPSFARNYMNFQLAEPSGLSDLVKK